MRCSSFAIAQVSWARLSVSRSIYPFRWCVGFRYVFAQCHTAYAYQRTLTAPSADETPLFGSRGSAGPESDATGAPILMHLRRYIYAYVCIERWSTPGSGEPACHSAMNAGSRATYERRGMKEGPHGTACGASATWCGGPRLHVWADGVPGCRVI